MSVEVVHEDHIAIITITRPEARNAVNGAVAQGIEQALDDYEADDSLWVAILTGQGLCLALVRTSIAAGNAAVSTKKGGLAAWFVAASKPMIAAVNGAAPQEDSNCCSRAISHRCGIGQVWST